MMIRGIVFVFIFFYDMSSKEELLILILLVVVFLIIFCDLIDLVFEKTSTPFLVVNVMNIFKFLLRQSMIASFLIADHGLRRLPAPTVNAISVSIVVNVLLKLVVSLDLSIHACKHMLNALHVLEIALIYSSFCTNCVCLTESNLVFERLLASSVIRRCHAL